MKIDKSTLLSLAGLSALTLLVLVSLRLDAYLLEPLLASCFILLIVFALHFRGRIS